MEIQTQGKTAHQEIKEGKRRKTALDIERSRVSYAREEAERQRQHETLIWDRKLELARLQAGVFSHPAPPRLASSFSSLMNNFAEGSGLGTQSSSSSTSGGRGNSPSASRGDPLSWGDLPEYTGNMNVN